MQKNYQKSKIPPIPFYKSIFEVVLGEYRDRFIFNQRENKNYRLRAACFILEGETERNACLRLYHECCEKTGHDLFIF